MKKRKRKHTEDNKTVYTIDCPYCGHNKCEKIQLVGQHLLGWVRPARITFFWNHKKVISGRCLKCGFISSFALEEDM